ncbi:DNA-3-methyladenine glycosylase 2 family protein [Shewanella jiangmenensis]|uniref:DNA-3-methyladenine glycosylase 2 family protein n=1 Tax=Shewanella jiangmenensis TaxID=2837387 RepID=UPI0032D8FB82
MQAKVPHNGQSGARCPDNDVCQRARLSRDARFDGVFFVGVFSTGIYCRPVCPAPLPKEDNVRYFASAQEAAAAGLRPCLRCRPESAPGSAPWRGTATTLGRAMALIDAGALNAAIDSEPDGSAIEALAARLGVGSRYLRKLFQEQLGMSPKAYGDYRRLLLAKALLHQTQLPMSEVAFAAGFGSLRRFNEVFRDKLALTPASLRRSTALPQSQEPGCATDSSHVRTTKEVSSNTSINIGTQEACRVLTADIRLTLSFRPPYDFMALRQFFMARAINGNEWFVDAAGEPCIGKALSIGPLNGYFEASPIKGKHALMVSIYPGPELGNLSAFLSQIRRVLDLDANLGVIEAHISDAIKSLIPKARLQQSEDGGDETRAFDLRALGMQVNSLPGAGSYFEACCRAVLGQQVSLTQATSLLNALVDEVGETVTLGSRECRLFPTPAAVAGAELATLKMPGARKLALNRLGALFAGTALCELAEKAEGIIADKASSDSAEKHNGIRADGLGNSADKGTELLEPTEASLLALKGIGPWTVNYASMRGLSSPDVLLDGDLIVRQRLELCGLAEMLPVLKSRVSPWGSYLTLMLWHMDADVLKTLKSTLIK